MKPNPLVPGIRPNDRFGLCPECGQEPDRLFWLGQTSARACCDDCLTYWTPNNSLVPEHKCEVQRGEQIDAELEGYQKVKGRKYIEPSRERPLWREWRRM